MSGDAWIRDASSSSFWRGVVDFYRHKRLAVFFARLSLLKFTRRTLLGYFWLPIRCFMPYVGAAVLANAVLSVDGVTTPYLLFLFSGALVWTLFSTSAYWLARSIELCRRYVRSHHASLLAYPAGFFAPALVNGAMVVALLCGLLGYYQYGGTIQSLAHPERILILAAAVVTALLQGAVVGLTLAPLALQTRDMRFALAYALGAMMLATPVAYPASALAEQWRWLAEVNPVAVAIDAFRFALFGLGEFDPVKFTLVAASSTLAAILAAAVLIFCEPYVKRHA